MRPEGRVVQVVGLAIEVEGLDVEIGEICHVFPSHGDKYVSAEVVGFKNQRLLMMPFADMHGVYPGAPVRSGGRRFAVPVGQELLGRVVDGLARPIDGKGPLGCRRQYLLTNPSPDPLRRTRISETLETGVRAIDGLITCGKGQRLGIFAASGVGKSTLMGMIARNGRSDVSVIALIGERGREVQEFIERDLGEEGLKRSVIVVSTSDQPALLRLKGAWVATAIAEYFRDQGLDVTFMMDSVTRFAMAQREIGLTVGEPPATRGYTPSVFALLPRLMERTGTSDRGTITGFYTVLMEGDDMNEPVTDTCRSILDGHIFLSRELASANHYPAIDVLNSISRLMSTVANASHQSDAGRLRSHLAVYRQSKDLVDTGAYMPGSDPRIDEALSLMPAINAFLRQSADEQSSLDGSVHQLHEIMSTKHGSNA